MRLRTRWLGHLSYRAGYGLVLLLIVVTYSVSLVSGTGYGAAVVVLVQMVALRLVLEVSHARRALLRVVNVLLVVVGGVLVLGILLRLPGRADPWFATTIFALSALLYGAAPLSILRDVIRRPSVDAQTLMAAIAAYAMLGMFFAFTFRAIAEVQAAPFFGTNGKGSMADDLFFSFVTLTTTGYGDLVPAGNPGQSLAVLEAVVGQLFLVTAVAKVVNQSGFLIRGRATPPSAGRDGGGSDPVAEPEAS
jgi:hypothetical protein